MQIFTGTDKFSTQIKLNYWYLQVYISFTHK